MNNLKYIRKVILKETQGQFASLLKLDQSAISKMEKVNNCSLQQMATIRAHAINKQVDWSDSLFFELPSPPQH